MTELIDACDGAVNARTVRYWIAEGLLQGPTGGRGPQARYSRVHAERVAEIRRLQSLGLSLESIGLLLGGAAPSQAADRGDQFWLQAAARPSSATSPTSPAGESVPTLIELAPGLTLSAPSTLDPLATAAIVQAAAPLVALYLNLTTNSKDLNRAE